VNAEVHQPHQAPEVLAKRSQIHWQLEPETLPGPKMALEDHQEIQIVAWAPRAPRDGKRHVL
jgi:hypothetical protein